MNQPVLTLVHSSTPETAAERCARLDKARFAAYEAFQAAATKHPEVAALYDAWREVSEAARRAEREVYEQEHGEWLK